MMIKRQIYAFSTIGVIIFKSKEKSASFYIKYCTKINIVVYKNTAQKSTSFYIKNKQNHNNIENANNILIFLFKLGKIPLD